MIKITFEAENLSDLKNQIAEVFGQSSESGETEIQVPAGKSKKKSEPEPEKKKKPEPITFDTVRELLISIEGKAEDKREIFANYGVKKLTEVSEDQLEDVYNDLKKLA